MIHAHFVLPVNIINLKSIQLCEIENRKKIKLMRALKRIIFLYILLSAIAATANAQERKKEDFDSNWKFILDSVNDYSETSVNDASWRKLNLPHDWSIEGTFSKDNPATPRRRRFARRHGMVSENIYSSGNERACISDTTI